MTRKAFIADVTSASEKPPPSIIDVERGDDDGEVNFVFLPLSGVPINIALLALDVSGYPSENTFMIFTKSPDIPPGVNEALEDVASFSAGMGVFELLYTISERLPKVLENGTRQAPISIDDNDSVDVPMTDGVEESESEEPEEEYDPGFDSEDDASFGYGPSGAKSSTSTYRIGQAAGEKLDRRIRQDLRNLKFSGFKIGILSGMKAESQSSLVSMSIQAAELGLSDEALQAWDLESNQYIVILIRYGSGYKTFDAVIAEPAKTLDISFRIGVSDKYKPTVSEALAAFTGVMKDASQSPTDLTLDMQPDAAKTSGFSSIFISSSMNDFVNDQFISLLKIRYSTNLGWDGAKHYMNDRQGRTPSNSDTLPPHYFNESKPKQSSLPDIMYTDHLTEDVNDRSFPLIAAQFSMRYLVRCTEFCLVCHDRIEGEFEALKPYVCDKPLCLYQYMSLGFGPSVEHEILTQPYVVDLLVSFCYSAAAGQRIREYPTGMSLSVPPVTTSVSQPRSGGRLPHVEPSRAPIPVSLDSAKPTSFTVKVDMSSQEVVFDATSSCPVHKGDWVVIYSSLSASHHRVEDATLFPTIRLGKAVVVPYGNAQLLSYMQKTTPATPATPATTPPPPPPNTLTPATLSIYDQNFDDMDNPNKCDTILMLLGTLPRISELQQYLQQQKLHSEPNLRAWKDRISPAALGLLRWILASNRSCIVQVDRCPGQEGPGGSLAKVRLDQKCSNVAAEWLQFRFAQGSPDKEQRFLAALKAEQTNLDAKHPTLFAFHGSALQNWHSIIRHGLDFKETINGRAYGHGVYHAMEQNVSIGYSATGAANSWPASDLNVMSAMSLNEIVNCPTKFASSHPYMVVQHVDWIQARYLFVQIKENVVDDQLLSIVISDSLASSKIDEVQQDPKFTAKTTLGKPVGVPHCAVSVSRAFREDSRTGRKTPDIPKSKRQRQTGGLAKTSLRVEEEELQDINFFISDDESASKGKENHSDNKSGRTENYVQIHVGKNKDKTAAVKSLTDFVPGSLDQSTLPLLGEPLYATSSATMRISRDLKELLKVQEKTPLHELGWYLNPDVVSNVYQWIVELHSFDLKLPLAMDMKAAGVQSVVLEIRFPKDYPHTPPFIRVIRPRFLPFMAGGGGHVTGGGAMCMELLTNTGWSSVSSIEGVLLQVRMAIMNLEPKPARLENGSRHMQSDYTTGEAIEAYKRACRAHGWEIPKDFNDFAATTLAPQ